MLKRTIVAAILAAYRHCNPAGQTAMVTIQYRITVAKTGRVRRAELLESSGNGQAVESTLNWPIPVRPPS